MLCPGATHVGCVTWPVTEVRGHSSQRASLAQRVCSKACDVLSDPGVLGYWASATAGRAPSPRVGALRPPRGAAPPPARIGSRASAGRRSRSFLPNAKKRQWVSTVPLFALGPDSVYFGWACTTALVCVDVLHVNTFRFSFEIAERWRLHKSTCLGSTRLLNYCFYLILESGIRGTRLVWN